MRTTSNSSAAYRLAGLVPALVACALLTGCPSASTPTKESGSSSPSLPGGTAGAPPTGGAPTGSPPAGSPGGSPDGNTSSPSASSTEGRSGSADASGQAGEPGFEPVTEGGQGLPDLSDNPARSPTTGPSTAATASPPPPSTSTGDISSSGTEQSSGAFPGQSGVFEGESGQGPLTQAEQVAILDAELERSTGDFDDLIRDEQAEQRQREREQTRQSPQEEEDTSSGAFPGTATTPSSGGFDGPIAAGTSSPGAPADPAKYPPPEDIPSGDDDDVVARQLREAAMREPDPAVRARLWDEYRRYKGLSP